MDHFIKIDVHPCGCTKKILLVSLNWGFEDFVAENKKWFCFQFTDTEKDLRKYAEVQVQTKRGKKANTLVF